MAREAREASAYGLYHVIQRGNNRKWLFLDSEDFLQMQKLIQEYMTEYKMVLHHYCLMSNHIHLLVKAKDTKLISKMMHGVQRSYHHYYRRKRGWSGHLFQGRYKSFPIKNEEHLLECGRYIERNPVRAEMVSDAGDWEYSSYRCYAVGEGQGFVELSPAYFSLSKNEEDRQRKYRQYVAEERIYEKLMEKALLKA